MAKVCQVTGKSPMVGNNVSHANNKTKRRFLPNLQQRRLWVESEQRYVRLRVTASGRDQRRQGLIPSARTDLTSRENRHA